MLKKFGRLQLAACVAFKGRMTELTHLALTDAMLAIRVNPNARRPGVKLVEIHIRVAVTQTPEAGKAADAARVALAKAFGVA